MGRVEHFEILADDPKRAAAFYEAALGWRIEGAEGMGEQYWLITTGEDGEPGINGGLMARHFNQPVINTVDVESLDNTIAKVQAAGGKLVHGPNEVPGIGTHAYFTDTEGNMFGAMQSAPL